MVSPQIGVQDPLSPLSVYPLPSAHMRSHLLFLGSYSETLMQKSGHLVKCSSHHHRCPVLAVEAWNCGVTCVLPLGPHPEPWQVLGYQSPRQRLDPHTNSLIALRPQEETVDIISGLQAQGFLVAEDTMG